MKKVFLRFLCVYLLIGGILPSAVKAAAPLVYGVSIKDKVNDAYNDINSGEYIPPEDIPRYPTSYQVLDEVIAISAGGKHTAAITADGTLYTWGSNIDGQLGIGHSDSVDGPQKVMDDVSYVSAGYSCTAAVKKDGTLWTWGQNYGHNLGFTSESDECSVPTKIMDDIASVSVGYDFMAVLKTDGTLWTFGENQNGQLGNGTQVASVTPVKIMDGVKAVSCGNWYSAAIRTDGTLWIWGKNSGGYPNWMTSEMNLLQPVQIMENVAAVDCYDHIAVVKNDHTLWIWGSNEHGQVGNGTWSDSSVKSPVQVMSDVQQVALGLEHTVALKTDGSVWSWGGNYVGQAGTYDYNTFNTLKHAIRFTPKQIIDQADSITAGVTHSFALDRDGFLWAWGSNASGQLGKGEIKDNSFRYYFATIYSWVTEDYRIDPVPIGRASDIDAEAYISDWARESVEAAKAAGLIPELTGTPNYRDVITREQFAELAVRFLETALGRELSVAPADTFSDCQNIAVRKAYAASVVSGIGEDTFSPATTTNREQIAVMITRTIDYLNAQSGSNLAPAAPDLSGFVDANAVSSWAADSMGRLVSNKILSGTSSISIQPKGYCTVEQSVLLLYRAYEQFEQQMLIKSF